MTQDTTTPPPMLVSELLAAGATGPLAAAWLGAYWQWAFALWVAPVPLLMLALIVGCRQLPAMANGSRSASLTLPNVRDGRTWRLVALLGSAAALYFTGNVFLTPLLEARAPLAAGTQPHGPQRRPDAFLGAADLLRRPADGPGPPVDRHHCPGAAGPAVDAVAAGRSRGVGGWLNDLSGTVALAFLPTLLISLVAMVVTPRLLASRQ
ncbi:hypothetical protein [Billgrantia endophytica]|uniref:Uncharacterized protein n=1 Tax=Billgrantia endophytica TaxID=2033802 RepID=A0A2N7TV80_9GAMM|nr:hypothetical protein [Halomonas endophytica]PMR72075.1 hypothetical protein C1H69_22080 [Halomonas endophytica]